MASGSQQQLSVLLAACTFTQRHAASSDRQEPVLLLTKMMKTRECSKASQQAAAGKVKDASEGGGADWVRQKARSTSQLALHAVRAFSLDSKTRSVSRIRPVTDGPACQPAGSACFCSIARSINANGFKMGAQGAV
eukprot:1158877-Pelagomonas_calceolata.AAC.1